MKEVPKNKIKEILLSIAKFIIIFITISTIVNYWQTRNTPKGQAPAFTAPAVLGKAQAAQILSLDQWRAANAGKPIILHFWATWCSICQLEQPNITSLSKDYPVLTIAMRSGDTNEVFKTMSQRGLNWATITDEKGEIAKKYGFNAVPAMVIIDKDGNISSASVGYTSEITMRLKRYWATL